jgi:hypothetical protein
MKSSSALERQFSRVKNSRVMISIFRHNTGHGKIGEGRPVHQASSAINQEAGTILRSGNGITTEGQIVAPNLIPADNPDRLKPSVDLTPPVRGLKWWRRHIASILRRYWHYLRPELTADELEEKQRLTEEKRFTRLMRREGTKYARMLTRKWAQLGYKHVTNKRVKLIPITCVSWNENGTVIVLHAAVQPEHLPEGVRLVDLADPKNTNELIPTLGHPVNVHLDTDGLSVEIHRAGKEGLPDFVTVAQMWDEMPENKPPLTFPVGVAANARLVYVDLDDCPHLLVAGGTKQGKSNFINAMLCTFIRRLRPDQVQFILFDLKMGVEFGFYEGLPHLHPTRQTPGIIETMDFVLNTMLEVHQIMMHRMKQIREGGYKNFNEFNLHRHGKNRLPAIVVVFDEWATISLTLPKSVNILTDIANMARAAGIFIVIGTQNPRADVLSTLIKLNFQVRLAFSVDMPASMAILGTHEAVGLSCQGRAILQNFNETYPVQTPFINNDLIRATVHKAITGKELRVNVSVDIEEILQYALDHQDGTLQIERLFEIFRKKKLRRSTLIEMLRDAEDKEYNLGGTLYKIKKASGTTPRSLLMVE